METKTNEPRKTKLLWYVCRPSRLSSLKKSSTDWHQNDKLPREELATEKEKQSESTTVCPANP